MIDIEASLDRLNTHRALALSVLDARETPDETLRTAIVAAETIEEIARLVTGREAKPTRRRRVHSERQLSFDFDQTGDLIGSTSTGSNMVVHDAETDPHLNVGEHTHSDSGLSRDFEQSLKTQDATCSGELAQLLEPAAYNPIHDGSVSSLDHDQQKSLESIQPGEDHETTRHHCVVTLPLRHRAPIHNPNIRALKITAPRSEIPIGRVAHPASRTRMPLGP